MTTNQITVMTVVLMTLVMFVIACRDDRFMGWLLTGVYH